LAKSSSGPVSLPALQVHQWLKAWDRFKYGPDEHRRKPQPYFYLFSMRASDLRQLSGVNRRDRSLNAKDDLGIQRRHEASRSEEIARYVESGFPFSVLSEVRREQPHNDILRKPGWLPTAIVVNVLGRNDLRRGRRVATRDLVAFRHANGRAEVLLPQSFGTGKTWSPSGHPPIEVIDGQHRLFAFDVGGDAEDFELPVVAFHGLDLSWQAYLFWTINIKPKKINPSLAFDLYPLLRTEDWLEIADEFAIYRETRAQELVETLWAYPKSPWHGRIDMVGQYGRKFVTQNSFVRSLLASMIKKWEGKGVSIGGLFGGLIPGSGNPLPWNRAQQAAFLIFFWDQLRRAVEISNMRWANSLRTEETTKSLLDPAFAGPQSLLNQDQGVRAVHHIVNDFCFLRAEQLDLESWVLEEEGDDDKFTDVKNALRSLARIELGEYLGLIAEALAGFDWRSANADLNDADRRERLAYRGSGGYAALRNDILDFLSRKRPAAIGQTASAVLAKMR
jgi:DGQHR domain-containing protein